MQHIEDQHTEFKHEWNDSAKKTAVAFANTDGGTIYIGIEDDGGVSGVVDVDSCMLQVAKALSDGIRPDLVRFISVSPETINGKSIVKVTVQRGTEQPYYLSRKGIQPSGVYVRSGAASIPATEGAIINMIKESSKYSFEDEPAVDQDLTFKSASTTFKASGVSFTKSAQRALGLIGANGLYTNLAWLLSDQCNASIKAAVFQGTTKNIFNSREEFSGSVFTQFNQTFEYLNRFNSTRSTFETLPLRHDQRDYDPAAIREALLNLIIHRDYSIAGPGLVSLFDDRAEFLNFGGLLRGITKKDIILGASLQRNPKLAQIFYRLHWVEAYGTGIPKIMTDYAEANSHPKIETSDNAFKLTLPSLNPSARPANDQPNESNLEKYMQRFLALAEKAVRQSSDSTAHSNRQTVQTAVLQTKNTNSMHPRRTAKDEQVATVLRYASSPEGVSRKELQPLIGLSQSGTGMLLRELIAAGQIEKLGNGRNTRYRTNHDI